MEGIQISFTPSIEVDYNFYGNVKYPQGFAFVFMSNSVNKAIGEKRSGISYDGLNNAVAFEFDFLQNTNKNDIKSPHFSAHYQIAGPISSITPQSCTNFCNVILPNFYDVQRPQYKKNTVFNLTINGGKLYLSTNYQTILNGVNFPYLDTLMDQSEVYFGITASMNLDKSISIQNLVISKHSNVPEITIENQTQSYQAGQPLLLNFSLKSNCGVALMLFTEDLANAFTIEVDGVNWKNNFMTSFADTHLNAILSINNLNTAKTISIVPKWNGVTGQALEVVIGPGAQTMYDICNPDYNTQTQYLNAIVTDMNVFNFTICSTDEYRNPKPSIVLKDSDLVKIGYPNMVPALTDITIQSNSLQTQFIVSVPLTGYGNYVIYNSNFFNGPQKFFTLSALGVDPNNSYAVINEYVVNKFTQVNNPVVLFIAAKDVYGTDLSIDQLNSFNCTLEGSTMHFNFQSQTASNDFVFLPGTIPVVNGYAALTYDPSQPGTYTFQPKITCGQANQSIELKCDLCTFYIPSTVPDTSRFKIFSDFEKKYFNSDKVNPLIISLDEAKNMILTSIGIIDTSGIDIEQPNINVNNVSAYVSLNGATIASILPIYTPTGFDLKSLLGYRTQLFSPLQVYTLNIKITDSNYNTNGEISIPVKFSYHNDYLNNINELSNEDIPQNFIVTFIPGSFTMTAASNKLLFRIISRNSNYELTMGKTLNSTNLLVTAIDQSGANFDLKIQSKINGYFLYVTGSPTKSGTYTVQVKYAGTIIHSMTLNVTPKSHIGSLLFDNSNPLIQSVSSNNTITLNNVEVHKTPSFVMYIVDKYQNQINNNFLEIFNKIAISKSKDVTVQPLPNGSLVVIFSGRQFGASLASLTLPNGQVYQINSNKISLKIDANNSISKLTSIANTVGSTLNVKVNLFDIFNSEISDNINANQSALQDFISNTVVYLIGPMKSTVNLVFNSYTNGDGYYFTTVTGNEPTVAGEYRLKAYYKNVSINCEVCLMELTPSVVDTTQTTAYWLGAKDSYQLYPNYYQLISNQNGLTVYLIFKDQYGNEIHNESVHNLVLHSESSTSIVKVNLCNTTQNLRTRQYFQVCPGNDQNIYNQLSSGNYYIQYQGNSFSFFITPSFFEANSSTISVSSQYSYIVNDNSQISGTVDVPARLIIDFRSGDNLRYTNLDVAYLNVTIADSSITDLSPSYIYGPNQGLITALLSSHTIGRGVLTISYNNTIIVTNISYVNLPGELNNIVYSNTISYSNGNYFLFNVTDITGHACDLHYDKNIYDSLISVSNGQQIIPANADFNPIACILSIGIDKRYSGALAFNSLYLPAPVNVLLSRTSLSTENSFAYLVDNSDAALNSQAILQVEGLDANYNSLSSVQLNSQLSKLQMLVLLKNGDQANYLMTEQAQINNQTNQIYFSHTFGVSGDYIFVPLLDNIKIACTMCTKKVIHSSVNLNNTKIQIKRGSSWDDKTQNMSYLLMQNTYPVFKLIFQDSTNTPVNNFSISNYSFALLVDDDSQAPSPLDVQAIQSKNNGVFVYLTESVRQYYQNLNQLTRLKLVMQNTSDQTTAIEFDNFIILATKEVQSDKACTTDSVPTFTNLSQYAGYFETGHDFIQEFSLEGCQKESEVIYDQTHFSISQLQNNTNYQINIIPADIEGNYLLFLTSNTIDNVPLELSLNFNSTTESSTFLVQALPNSKIGTIQFSSADDFNSSNSFTYLYVTVFDKFENLVTSNNLFYPSLDLSLNITDSQNNQISYRTTFSPAGNKFLVEVPVSAESGSLTVNSKYSVNPFTLNINNRLSLKNTLVSVSQSDTANKKFTVVINLRDQFLNSYSSSSGFNYTTSFDFIFYTYNPITLEKAKIEITDIEQRDPSVNPNVLSLTLPQNIPIYEYAVIIPFYEGNSLVCSSCLIVSRDNGLLYQYSNDGSWISIANYITINSFEQLILMSVTSKNAEASLNSGDVISTISFGNSPNFVQFYGYNSLAISSQVNTTGNDTLNYGNGHQLSIYEDTNTIVSSDNVDVTKSLLHSVNLIKINPGRTHSLFIEARDSNNLLTNVSASLALSNPNLAFNLINSSIAGFYLLEIASDVEIDSGPLTLNINNQVLPSNLNIKVRSGFPVSLTLSNFTVINSNTVSYQISALDSLNNKVCDERINLSAKISNTFLTNSKYYMSNNICYYYISLSGTAIVNSPLLHDSISAENFSGLTVSSFESSLIVDTNILTQSSQINLSFNLLTELGHVYSADSISTTNEISLNVYRILDNGSKIFVIQINNLNYKTSSFTSNDLNMNDGDYLIFGVVNGVELRNFLPIGNYIYLNQNPSDISIQLKQNTQWLLPNTSTNSNSTNISRIKLAYPVSFMLNILNQNNKTIPISNSIILQAALFQDPFVNSSSLIFNLENVQTTDKAYLFEIPKDVVSTYLHLPVGNYTFAFIATVNNTVIIQRWLPIKITRGLFQNKHLNVPYSLSGDVLSTKLTIANSNNGNIINSNVGTYSKTNLCIISNKKIYNEYLDTGKFVINNMDPNNCSYAVSTLLRGCVDLYINCKNVAPTNAGYTITFTYNNINVTPPMILLIDPQLPPSNVQLIQPFPSKILENTEMVVKFNLLDASGTVFQYLTQDNFEVFVNDQILPNNKWIVWYDKNSNLKILNADYPPRNQNIQIYFKDWVGMYTYFPELSVQTTVLQGSFDLTKSVISLPLTYRAGNRLGFTIVLRDYSNNCFEDDVKLGDLALASDLVGANILNYSLTQDSINFPFCRRILTVTFNNSPFTVAGSNQIQLIYQNKTKVDAELFISPNEISATNTQINVVGFGVVSVAQVQAGSSIQFILTGTDAYSNSISYYDLAQRFDMNINGLKKNSDYFFVAQANQDNSGITITLVVGILGKYSLTYLLDGAIFNIQTGLTSLVVTAGICSNAYPNYQINSNLLYTGNYGVLSIACLDNFKNSITIKGNENFNIRIKGTNLEVVGEDTIPYSLNYNNGVYQAKFLLAYMGQYTGQIYLNGNKYGDSFVINVQSSICPIDSPNMCSNRQCVQSKSDCVNDIDAVNCKDQNNPFSCLVNGVNTCVSNLSDCDCTSGFNKCNGMCVPNSINNICNQPSVTDCQRRLPLSVNPTSCKDGSCRTKSECPNPMGCPIGFIACGAGCIPRNTQCVVNAPQCSSSQVVCWDLSCADSLETCPTAKTCNDPNAFVCPDGKCVSDVSQCAQPPMCTSPFNYLCSDFTCKQSAQDCNKKSFCYLGQSLCENNICAEDCSKNSICPANMFICSNGQCVANSLLCPTSVSCPPKTIKCPTGSCAGSYEECKFTSAPSLSTEKTCPLTSPILCPDLSCAQTVSNCNIIPSCPTERPYRCADNSCGKSRQNCPSITTCPSDFPVLCVNGSCNKASYHCADNALPTCNGFRCWNGSCVSSSNLCPSEVSCGNRIKCWDGSCVNDIKDCATPSNSRCPTTNPFRCADGSCRINQNSCSSISVCPEERPVKCYDNSCKEHINLCPAYQSCGANMKSCPDGTCTSDICNTIVTCPTNMSFLCYDNSCAADNRDCPTPPSCAGVFCPDGSCVSNRLLCKFFQPCSAANPVRCSYGSCAATVDSCYSILTQCPIGYVLCSTGGCKMNQSMCQDYTCPKHLPYLCPEGVCKLNGNYCDDPITGCPYNQNIKCNDGTCVNNSNTCIKFSKVTCPPNSISCPDGSCSASSSSCPLVNGCPVNKPQKCSNGLCVDPSRLTCSPPSCPFNLPIQCQNGQCVSTTSNCPSSLRDKDFKDCNSLGFNNLYMCADGSCVPTPDYCKPLFGCPNGYIKCPDGTCKLSGNQCQASSNCPAIRPIRCEYGNCVAQSSECFTNIFCPVSYPILCSNNKNCVNDISFCPNNVSNANGCPILIPFKCFDGRCMSTQDQCTSVDVACSSDFPILCPDGTCKDVRTSCSNIQDACPQNYTRCLDGTCVPQASYMLSCKNKIGCPLVKPMRCSDGSCAAKSSDCLSNIECSSDFPVLCADLSCAADAKFCKILYPCLDNYQRCNNGFCVKYDSYCETISNLCPLSAPTQCATGKCVKDINECSLEYPVDNCRDKHKFFCTRTSECVNNVAECVGANYAAGIIPGTSRLLQQTTTTTPQNQCFSDAPYSCYDGTCRVKSEDCPILPACNVMEYRCSNGSCQKDPKKCNDQSVVCSQGLNKCEDGLCRLNCPQYNGCGLANPFQCTNGMCLKNTLECIGLSMCKDSSSPFRCIDGACVSSASQCPDIKRLNHPSRQRVSVSTLNNIDINFAYDNQNKNIGKLYIPANSLQSNPANPTNYTSITFEAVADSSLYQYYITYNNTNVLMFDISNGVVGSDGVLDFENSVHSAVVKISGNNMNENFTYPGLIYLENNYLAQSQFDSSDYCLSKLANNQWNCLVRKSSDDQTTFVINSFGIYAVVLNPMRQTPIFDSVDSSGNNLFFENLKLIVIVIGSLFISIITILYIFSRVLRYREKYRDNKETLVNMLNQMQEYKNMSTDVPGQTLGDNIAGIVFTKNPAHSVSKNPKGSINDVETEIEELQKKCKVMEIQNRSYEERIEDVNEEFRMLKSEIEKIKRNKKQEQ